MYTHLCERSQRVGVEGAGVGEDGKRGVGVGQVCHPECLPQASPGVEPALRGGLEHLGQVDRGVQGLTLREEPGQLVIALHLQRGALSCVVVEALLVLVVVAVWEEIEAPPALGSQHPAQAEGLGEEALGRCVELPARLLLHLRTAQLTDI